MSLASGVFTRTRSKSTLQVNSEPKDSVGIKKAPLLATKKNPISEKATTKRKRGITSSEPKKEPKSKDLAQCQEEAAPPKKKTKIEITSNSQSEEIRSRLFRKWAPKSYLERLGRATSQRMFVIERTHGGTSAIPEQIVEMAGSTGNIYRIRVCLEPTCTCPDNKKGNQCKHIVYVLHNVLKAPEHLQYQLAFVPSELRTIFSLAPPIPTAADSTTSSSNPSNRKEVSGDCPVCFTEFEPEKEEIVWCKAACGNNIHKTCFEQWAKSRNGQSGVRCVYCRTPWQGDDSSIAKIKSTGRRNEEGYVNVGNQLGLAQQRDMSSYHQFWVRGQRNWG